MRGLLFWVTLRNAEEENLLARATRVFEIRESYRARKGGMDVILHCAAADANRPHDKSFEKKNIASFRLTTALQKDKGFSITNPQQLLPLAKVTVEAHALVDIQLPVANGNPTC
jgi:hypothetical protein